jgi:serine/threonine protein kinase
VRPLADAAVGRLRHLVDEPDLDGTPYRLGREIARGGMGVVYEAVDERLDRKVALKVLHVALAGPEHAARMVREARVVARLEHPGIVPIHDVGTLADGRVFYAMKLVEGRRLDQVPLGSIPEVLRLFEKLCEAVAFAHDRGVVHRDLKPANVMVGAFGEVLVMDWGLAKLLAAPESEGGTETGTGTATDTRVGTVMGTPGYMAPEQARGEIDRIGPRSDVYGLGMILRGLLAASPADDSATRTWPPPAADAAPAARELRPEVPKALAAIVAKATAEDPVARYRDASDLVADVRRLLDERPVAAYRESWLERLGRVLRRYRTPILLILTYLVVRALMLIFLGR